MYGNQNDKPMNSGEAEVDSPSPKRVTASRRNRNKNSESPMSSPLKQPRCPVSYSGYSATYQPPSRQDILGKPVEIIPGKYTRSTKSFSLWLFLLLQINFTGCPIWNRRRTTRTLSSSILIMIWLTSRLTRILDPSTWRWSTGSLGNSLDSFGTRISQRIRFSTTAPRWILETKLSMVPSWWAHSWLSYSKWRQRTPTPSLSPTTQFSDTTEMLPRASASTIAPCSIACRDLSMLCDSDGMISDPLMSKSTNTTSE